MRLPCSQHLAPNTNTSTVLPDGWLSIPHPQSPPVQALPGCLLLECLVCPHLLPFHALWWVPECRAQLQDPWWLTVCLPSWTRSALRVGAVFCVCVSSWCLMRASEDPGAVADDWVTQGRCSVFGIWATSAGRQPHAACFLMAGNDVRWDMGAVSGVPLSCSEVLGKAVNLRDPQFPPCELNW